VGNVPDKSRDVKGRDVPTGVITVGVFDESRDDVVVNGVRGGGRRGVTWDLKWVFQWVFQWVKRWGRCCVDPDGGSEPCNKVCNGA
jgi:hypothetical protein